MNTTTVTPTDSATVTTLDLATEPERAAEPAKKRGRLGKHLAMLALSLGSLGGAVAVTQAHDTPEASASPKAYCRILLMQIFETNDAELLHHSVQEYMAYGC